MNNTAIDSVLTLINFEVLISIGLITALLMYVVFALLVVRQASLMSQVLHTRLSPQFKFFAYLHLIFSLIVFIVSLMLLTT